MSKLFPPMTSKPEKIQIFAIIPCWIWVFVLFPMFLPFVGLGIWDQHEISVWLEIVYHVANGLLLLMIVSGGLLLIYPGTVTDVIGLALVAAVLAVQLIQKKNAKTVNA